MDLLPDDRYRSFPVKITAEEERHYGYLRSLTPTRELAKFVGNWAHFHRDAKEYAKAVKTFYGAMLLDHRYDGPPREGEFKQYDSYKQCMIATVELWEKHLKNRYPPLFPRIELVHDKSRRRFKALPWELERGFSMLEAIERLLNDPYHKRELWDPLWQGRPLKYVVPKVLTIDRTKEQYV